MSFYPPEWDYNRLMTGPADDLLTLTDEQHTTLMDGLRAAGLFDDFIAELQRRDQEVEAAAEESKTEEERLADRETWAPYIDTLKNVFKFSSNDSEGWAEWGFVVFRTTAYGSPQHDAHWADFRKRWDQIIADDYADTPRGFHPKSDRAIDLLTFRWVEDPALEGVSPADVSRQFDEMWPTLPHGLATSVCLMVTPEVLDSVLNSPLPSSAPLADRANIPFVVAVSRAAHHVSRPPQSTTPEEEDVFGQDFRGYFRVAAESLLRDFYSIVALDIMDLPRLTVGMRHEKDIWCNLHKYSEQVRYYVGEDTA